MWRSQRIQSRSSSGRRRGPLPRAPPTGERRGRASSSSRGDGGEALRLGLGAARCSALRARNSGSSARRADSAPASSGWRAVPGGAAIAQPAAAASRRARRSPRARARRCSPRASSGARAAPSRAVRTCDAPRSARGIVGRPVSGFVRSSTSSQSGSSASSRKTPRARARSFGRHSTTTACAFGRAGRAAGRRPRGRAVLAREARRRGLRGLVARREERVERREQPLALRPAGRIAEPLGREERRDRERLRVAQREVRQARKARLEAVDDVEAAECEREREVRADADRDAHPAAPRDRHRRPEGDDLGVEAVEERAPSGGEVAGPVRRREHGHRVPQRAQLPRDARPRARSRRAAATTRTA